MVSSSSLASRIARWESPPTSTKTSLPFGGVWRYLSQSSKNISRGRISSETEIFCRFSDSRFFDRIKFRSIFPFAVIGNSETWTNFDGTRWLGKFLMHRVKKLSASGPCLTSSSSTTTTKATTRPSSSRAQTQSRDKTWATHRSISVNDVRFPFILMTSSIRPTWISKKRKQRISASLDKTSRALLESDYKKLARFFPNFNFKLLKFWDTHERYCVLLRESECVRLWIFFVVLACH